MMRMGNSTSLPNWLVFSKPAFVIWGLILSHVVVEYTVVNVLMNYLTEEWKGPSLREAAMVVNLFDGIKAVSVVAVMHISDAYTGPFNMIILCTAAYAMGLMLLWVSSKSLDDNLKTFFFALLLIALGRATKDPILKDFLDNQLSQKLKKENPETSKKKEKAKTSNKNGSKSTFWLITASITGIVIAVFSVAWTSWRTTFKISSLLMGAMYVLFYSGFLCYYPEERPTGSPLMTIYRVLKAAIKKCRLPYPRSAEEYYNPNNLDVTILFYQRQDHGNEVHLLPHVPSFLLFFDRAAIKRNHFDGESEEKNGELCRVEQVREVKNLYLVVRLGFFFFAYTLVSASGNTYFVQQASNWNPTNFPIHVFFVLRALTKGVVNSIQKRRRRIKTLRIRACFEFIGIGMFCAVACSIAAWQVELHRLSLIKKYRILESTNPDNKVIPLSIMVLAPQYFLLGVMASGEKALANFAKDNVPKSMRKYVKPCTGIMLAVGKICSIICVLIFRSWFKESINTSYLDRYFLMLAILNFIFFCIYVYYYCGLRDTFCIFMLYCYGLIDKFGIFVYYYYKRLREVFGIFVNYYYDLRHKSTQVEGSNKEGQTSSNDAAEGVQKGIEPKQQN